VQSVKFCFMIRIAMNLIKQEARPAICVTFRS